MRMFRKIFLIFDILTLLNAITDIIQFDQLIFLIRNFLGIILNILGNFEIFEIIVTVLN